MARRRRRTRRPLAWLACLALLAVAVAAEELPDAAPWRLDWAREAVFYEVFVRSFADSDGDGVGDLRGLTERLDYLNDGDPATATDLGVTGLWLMPIFESPSYHGYDTVDYDRIDPEYGGEEDFQRFLAAAHRRGMRVVLDLVINHTSDRHPWFVESSAAAASARRDWYVWRADDPGWRQPWGGGPTWHPRDGAYYYGVFWSGMPDLNVEAPAVRAELARIARRWLDLGADGYRLDAARHLVAGGPGEAQNDTPATHAFWREFAAGVRRHHPEALLVGEVWSETPVIAGYYGGEAGAELPMLFDFPLAAAIEQALLGGDGAPVSRALGEALRLFPPGALAATFTGNHDLTRLASRLDGDPRRLRTAAALLLTLPGTPFLYYGDEVGLAGGPREEGDPAKRTPMPWDAAGAGFSSGRPWRSFAPGIETANVATQSAEPDSLLAWHRRLIHLRRATPALSRGGIEVLLPAPPGEPSPVLAFRRTAPEGDVLVAHNLTDRPALLGPLAIPAASLAPLFPAAGGPPAAVATAGFSVELAAGETRLWRLLAPAGGRPPSARP